MSVKPQRKTEAVSQGRGSVFTNEGAFWWTSLFNISITEIKGETTGRVMARYRVCLIVPQPLIDSGGIC